MIVPLEKPGTPEELIHFGVKGMKWGVRNTDRGGGIRRAAGATKRGIGVGIFALQGTSHATHMKIASNAGDALRKNDLPGIKAKHGDYGKLSNRAKKPFSKEAKAYRADVKKAYVKRLEESANAITNRSGTHQYTLSERGKPNTSQYFWDVEVRRIKHADGDDQFSVRPIFDDEGWIVDFEIVEGDMKQTAELGAKFLAHMGVDI